MTVPTLRGRYCPHIQGYYDPEYEESISFRSTRLYFVTVPKASVYIVVYNKALICFPPQEILKTV
jgi:hypothetical protein